MATTRNPNVVLLIADSVRADALSCYGADESTPGWDAVADRGTCFENTYASGPGTPTSHASMFSGKHPSETGVVLSKIPIPESTTLLAPWLRDRGYETLGVAGPSLMGSEFGFGRGFDRYIEPYTDLKPKHPSYFYRALTDALLRGPMLRSFYRFLTAGHDQYTALKLEALVNFLDRSDDPALFVANLLTPHLPYDPPRPYKERATPELDRPRWAALEEIGRSQSLDRNGVRSERVLDHGANDRQARFLADPDYYNEAELETLRAWYRGGVRYVGDQLRLLLERLEARGILSNTVVVVTSDHGDFIGEHGLFAHGSYLHEEVTRVPLIVVGPGIPAGERRSGLASHVDIFDTICDLAGLDRPETTSGHSLFGDEAHEEVYSEHGLSRRAREQRYGKLQYMDDEQAHEFSAGRKTVRTDAYRLELVSDGTIILYERPSEERIEDPDIAAELRQRLVQTLGSEFRSRDRSTNDLDPDVKSNLRELGYVV